MEGLLTREDSSNGQEDTKEDVRREEMIWWQKH